MKSVYRDSYQYLRPSIEDAITRFNQIGKSLHDGRNVVKVIDVEGESLNFKRFKKPNTINKIVYKFFRKSKAQRSFEYATVLKEKGIGTPDPVAYLEEESLFNFGTSFYISKQLNCDFTYRELINDDSIEDKEQILKEFTRFIYHMHEAGVYFLDNSPGNTLITKVDDHYEFALVDLNRMKFYNIPWDDRLKNFERLSPHKWMYEVMGLEYATLSRKRPEDTISQMWNYTQNFQDAFHRKKRLKKKLKSLINGKN
ncbi:Kdo domain containing protein [Nonlabens arenilitoris]|uniref:Kdo domain containing protein n=1 Tax=Nonlabens arenilitoris TaxID=1217969 RepID=A0A2S7UCV0_9FLAO|nr:lipopolysaccharide kinase InaA family protein [Nonlabens arenilitoris]PQJ32072.1 Kdo domain containing protein [Nonlabens arenilitoris]